MAVGTVDLGGDGSAILTPDRIRELQAQLVKLLGARIPIDGQLGPLTAAAARDALDRGSTLLDPDVFQSAMLAAKAEPSGQPLTWVFHRNEDPGKGVGPEGLRPDMNVFWKRGPLVDRDMAPPNLGSCDSVLIVLEGSIAATGVLLAGDSLRFVDRAGHLRHPVRIRDRIKPPIPYDKVERVADDQEIYRLEGRQLKVVREALNRHGPRVFPLPSEAAYRFASEHSLTEYLEQAQGLIMPDAATAEIIGWQGDIWPPVLATGEDATAAGDARFPFVLDAPVGSEDHLERGPFALFLAQRLHLIWCQINGYAPGSNGERLRSSPADADTFIAQVDSPWGGGKTTFANFIARVLDPREERLDERHFLQSSLAPTAAAAELKKYSLDDVFAPDYARRDPDDWQEARRPWIITRYNAWRDQYVLPPWWHLFQTIETGVGREVLNDAFGHLRAAIRQPRRFTAGLGALSRWSRIKLLVLGYKLWNNRVKGQVLVWLLMVGLLALLYVFGVVDYAVNAATKPANGGPGGLDAKELSAWVVLAIAVLGLGGASFATLMTVTAQSLSPDLDFSAEHKQIGVRDPISRFRRMFHHMLELSARPVLLIVDDLDRCEPSAVVEILRGFQTIVRSPRLFVLLLGDRAWIETAHDIHHKELVAMRGSEGTLGSLFVQKVIQLSFRLPTIKDDARARFARVVLGDPDISNSSAAAVRDAITEADQLLSEAVGSSNTVAERERKVEAAKRSVTEKFGTQLEEAEQKAAAVLIDDLANVRMVAAAGADTRQQQSVASAVERLIDSLPNNPRQIKRIFMAFSTYEAVGRAYFGYSLTGQGEDGERKARRWRQLAMWVTLATEWPDSWRSIARCPRLADAAYGEGAVRTSAEAELLGGVGAQEQINMAATIERLRADAELTALLGRRPNAVDEFGHTAMESEAVYEFNRIIWEPGFRLRPQSPRRQPDETSGRPPM